MNQRRKNSSYESSARIAFWSIVATSVIVMLLLLFPKIAEPQNVEFRKPDISSQEHLLAGTMISYTSGYLLEQGFNMRYGNELGLIAGGLAGYLKERSDPVFDMTDLSFTIAGSIAGLYINKGIQRWYGLSDYQIMKKKIKRLEKRAERLKRFTNPI